MNNFKWAVDRTGTTMDARTINNLRTLLTGEALREFDELASWNTGTNNSHLKFIQEGLLGYFFPINALSKKRCSMRRVMHKPQDIPFKSFAARLTELNKYLTLFTGSSAAKYPPRRAQRYPPMRRLEQMGKAGLSTGLRLWDENLQSYVQTIWKNGSCRKSSKVETLLKIQLGQIQTVPDMSGNEREENPPRLPTPRRTALASAGQKCRPPEKLAHWREKMIVAWTRALYRRV